MLISLLQRGDVSAQMLMSGRTPVYMIRVGDCFERSELELEIFETVAIFDHMNGRSAGRLTLNAKLPSVKLVPAGQG